MLKPIRVEKKRVSTLAFASLAVVQPSEGLVFGDVGVEEFERVLRDDAVRDHFVVSYDVDKGQSVEAVFGVGLHRVELHLSCWPGSQLAMQHASNTGVRRTDPPPCLQPTAAGGSPPVGKPGRDLTVVLVLHPGEGDPSEVALAEAQQERSGFSVLEQIPFYLFTHEPHDVAAWEKTEASGWGLVRNMHLLNMDPHPEA